MAEPISSYSGRIIRAESVEVSATERTISLIISKEYSTEILLDNSETTGLLFMEQPTERQHSKDIACGITQRADS
jgi:hypothetical protein